MRFFRPNFKKLIKRNDIKKLTALLSDRKPDIRMEAFLALAGKDDENIIKELKKLMNDPDTAIRAVVTLKYGNLGDSAFIDNIRTIIYTGTPVQKVEALRMLEEKDLKAHPEISVLLKVAIIDKSHLVRGQALRVMGTLKDPHFIDYLIEGLKEKHPFIRLNAVKALGEIKDEKSLNALVKTLVDRNEHVNVATIEAFKKIGKEDIIEDAPLIMRIEKMYGTKGQRIDTIKEVGRRTIKHGYLILEMACSDEYKEVRREAIRAIGRLKEKRSVRIVKRMLEDEYHDVRFEAVRVLGQLLDPNDIECIEKMKNDPDKDVREEAAKVYEKLKSEQGK